MPVALVLSAGLGTRLRPLSWLRAKPALPVAGAPLIAHILRGLASHGVREAIVNLHHRSETVAAAVGDGAAFGVRVRYSWEQPLLGSGGGPARAFSLLDGDELLIVNGDTLTDIDLRALYVGPRRLGRARHDGGDREPGAAAVRGRAARSVRGRGAVHAPGPRAGGLALRRVRRSWAARPSTACPWTRQARASRSATPR